MKTFGGFLCYEKYYGCEYHNAYRLNSARNCLRYLIRAKQIKKLYMPYMNCDVVFRVCEEEGVDIQYYNIDSNMRPIIDFTLAEDEYLYIVNYYGQIYSEEVFEFKKKYKNIIFDNAQAFFAQPISNVDTIYSCRKFFGVSDGAYLYTDGMINCSLERDISYPRLHFLSGSFEYGASEFYDSFLENEKKIDCLNLMEMSDFTMNLLRSFDYDQIKKRREENYIYLHNCLKNVNRLKPIIPEGPYMYPLFICNGRYIREKLIERGIFIPQLWPNVIECMNEKTIEYCFAQDILPLPCDQRYGMDDMKSIYSVVSQYV